MRQPSAVYSATILLTIAVMPAGAGEAKSLFQSHFAGVDDGAPCYARSYSAEHLKEHPTQRVGKIILDMDKTSPDGVPITEETIGLGFGVQLKSSSEWYTNSAICKSEGATISCFLEGDGGSFTVSAADGGAIKIESGSYGLAIEGMSDFLELPGDKGDDRVFILPHAARAECDKATADVAPAP